MFDYMIKILDNNRLLVRNNDSKTSRVLKADEISKYFENVLKEQFEAQFELDKKVDAIKNQVEK